MSPARPPEDRKKSPGASKPTERWADGGDLDSVQEPRTLRFLQRLAEPPRLRPLGRRRVEPDLVEPRLGEVPPPREIRFILEAVMILGSYNSASVMEDMITLYFGGSIETVRRDLPPLRAPIENMLQDISKD